MILLTTSSEVKNLSYTNRSGGFQQYGFSHKAPVEIGKIYEADINEMSRRGDAGIAKIQGFVVFVSEAKPGDHVKFEITRVGRRHATAEVVKETTEKESQQGAQNCRPGFQGG